MSNPSSIILSHNKRLLGLRITEYGCNCRTRENCPLQNQCLTSNLVYRADPENNANKGTKYSLVSQNYLSKHGLQFTRYTKKSTESPKYMWLLKEDQIRLESDDQLLKNYIVEQKLIIVHYV